MKQLHRRYTLREIKDLAFKRGLVFLSSSYCNAKIKYNWKCNKCNATFFRTWNSLSVCKKCPNCKKIENKKNKTIKHIEKCHLISKQHDLTFFGEKHEWHGQKHNYKWQCNKCGHIFYKNHNTMSTVFYKCGSCIKKEIVHTKSQINLISKVYGQLTVLSLELRNPRKWLCRCECGEELLVKTSSLTTGKTTRCQRCAYLGARETAKKRKVKLIGVTYNSWTIISVESNSVLCRCECGEVRKVVYSHLRNEKSKNCGCKKSKTNKTEEECRTIFEEIFNKDFPSRRPKFLKNIKTGGNLELDGYCESLKLAFEYDGEQHYKAFSFGSNDSQLKHRQELDKLKDELCEEEGIELIRIPYWEKNNLKQFIKKSLEPVKPK